MEKIYVVIIQNVPGRTIDEIKLLFGTFHPGGGGVTPNGPFVFSFHYFLNIPI